MTAYQTTGNITPTTIIYLSSSNLVKFNSQKKSRVGS